MTSDTGSAPCLLPVFQRALGKERIRQGMQLLEGTQNIYTTTTKENKLFKLVVVCYYYYYVVVVVIITTIIIITLKFILTLMIKGFST